MPALVIIVAIGLISIWLLLSPFFTKIGEFIINVLDKVFRNDEIDNDKEK